MLLFLFRLIFVSFLLSLLFRLFGIKQVKKHGVNQKRQKPHRFEVKDEDIEDANFEEIKD